MKETGYIYIIKNYKNNKVYIGQTTQDVEKRFKQHLKCSKSNKNQLIYKAIMKYGKANFFYSILEKCKINELNAKEEYYIDLYNSYTKGYNLTKGGDQSRRNPVVLDYLKIINMYNAGKPLRYIGNIVGVSPSTISNILDKNNIQRRQKNYKILNSFNIDEQQLKGFLELGWSYRKIARFFKTDHHTIKRAVERYSL